MDKNYLITYFTSDDECRTSVGFAWFETQEELNEFVDDYSNDDISEFEIIEIIKINSCEVLYDSRDNIPYSE